VKLRFFSSLLPGKRCDKCNRRFYKIEELMQHKQVVHGKDLFYYCKRCNVNFEGMEQMRDHLKKFHSYSKTDSNKTTKKI
jgi:KRAB domain-containing zinc finger protein